MQRLTAAKERQEFADLLHWFRSQPADDEFSKVAKLLGFLTLVGNNLPEALAEEVRAIRSLSERIKRPTRRRMNGSQSFLPKSRRALIHPRSLKK